MKIKRYMALAIACGLLLPVQVHGARAVKILVHGRAVQSDVAPVIEKDRTLVPLRVISENLGYQVDWNQRSREVTVRQDSKSAVLRIGSSAVKVEEGKNKRSMTIDVPAKIIKDRTFVPLRAVGEFFGEEVNWDNDSSTVFIGKKTPAPSKTNEGKEVQPPSQEAGNVTAASVEGYRVELQKLIGDRGAIHYDDKTQTFDLTPKGLSANLYRYLRDHKVVDGEFKTAFHDEMTMMKEYSLKMKKETGKPYGLRITDPEDASKTLVLVRDGQLVENNVSSVQ